VVEALIPHLIPSLGTSASPASPSADCTLRLLFRIAYTSIGDCRAAMSLLSSARPKCHACALRQQIRHASLIRRPKKPYTFTQLITLSDGSTFTHRTTSPQPIYRSTKDTKNSALWNPSSQKLLNIEEDEAGRLKRFRRRFGRGFDAEAMEQGEEVSSSGFRVKDRGWSVGHVY